MVEGWAAGAPSVGSLALAVAAASRVRVRVVVRAW
jgi:hypothetical protein